MAELNKFVEESDKVLAKIEEQELRQDNFMFPLEKELVSMTTQHFPEINDYTPEIKLQISYRAFERIIELWKFMFLRIYNGVDDLDEDSNKFYVPPRYDVEGDKRKLAKKLEKVDPAYHAVYIETNQEMQDLLRIQNEFVYDCFDKAKKALWISFPEISELTGNSILYMNVTAFERMWYFMIDLYDIMDSQKNLSD